MLAIEHHVSGWRCLPCSNPGYSMLTRDQHSALKEQSTDRLQRNKHASVFPKDLRLGPIQALKDLLHEPSLQQKEPKALEGDKMETLPQRGPIQPTLNPSL